MDELLRHKLFPALLVGITIGILVFFFSSISFAVIFSSFASSAFIVYSIPKSKSAQVQNIILAYCLSAVSGYAASFLTGAAPMAVVAGLSVFLSALLMLVFDKAHAPACGIGLAFVIFNLQPLAIGICILGGLVIVSIAKISVLLLKEGHDLESSIRNILG
jgi:CBS-domain-containing membrane protein